MTQDGAATSTLHIIVSLYPSLFDAGSERAIRASASLLVDGSVIVLTTSGFPRYTFPHTVIGGIDVVRSLSTSLPGYRFTIHDADGSIRALFPAGATAAGYVEIATVRESGGHLVDTWDTRSVISSGTVTEIAYNGDMATISCAGGDVVGTGTIFGGQTALTSSAFADLASTADYARAPRADGVWPPIPIGPSDGVLEWYSPAMVVQDMVAGSPGVDATPARFLVTREQLNIRDLAAGYEAVAVKLVNPRTGSAFRGAPSYTATPVDAADGQGLGYTYVAGLWVEDGGIATHTNAGSVDVDGSGLGRVQPGDIWRVVGDGDDDYRLVDDSTDTTLTLATAYPTTHGTSTGEMVLRSADIGDALFVEMTDTGGIVGPRGGALSNPAEVVEWMLSRDTLSVPVNIGDLRACAGMMDGLHIQTVIREDGNPLEWVRSRIYDLFPLLPYVADGQLRHAWVGLPDVNRVVADLTDAPGLVLLSASTVQPEGDAVSLRYRWDIRRGRLTALSVLSGYNDPADMTTYYLLTGQAMRARSQAPALRVGHALRTLELSSDVVGDQQTAGYILSWVMWSRCRPYVAYTLAASPAWRWLRPGDVVTYSDRLCLVVSITGISGVTLQIRSL